MPKLSNALTIIVVILTIGTVAVFMLGQSGLRREEYRSNLKYSYTREVPTYDYSCAENVYGLYVILTNTGAKIVDNLSVSITNPLCVGSVPPLPASLDPNQTIKLYLYSDFQNGTVTISGNNTDLQIAF